MTEGDEPLADGVVDMAREDGSLPPRAVLSSEEDPKKRRPVPPPLPPLAALEDDGRSNLRT